MDLRDFCRSVSPLYHIPASAFRLISELWTINQNCVRKSFSPSA